MDTRGVDEAALKAVDEAIADAIDEGHVVLYNAAGDPIDLDSAVSQEVRTVVRSLLTGLLGRMPNEGFDTRESAKEAIATSLREVLARYGNAEPAFSFDFNLTTGLLTIKRKSSRGDIKADIRVYHVVAELAYLAGFSYWAMTRPTTDRVSSPGAAPKAQEPAPTPEEGTPAPNPPRDLRSVDGSHSHFVGGEQVLNRDRILAKIAQFYGAGFATDFPDCSATRENHRFWMSISTRRPINERAISRLRDAVARAGAEQVYGPSGPGQGVNAVWDDAGHRARYPFKRKKV
jgi:hypothetical protein